MLFSVLNFKKYENTLFGEHMVIYVFYFQHIDNTKTNNCILSRFLLILKNTILLKEMYFNVLYKRMYQIINFVRK